MEIGLRAEPLYRHISDLGCVEEGGSGIDSMAEGSKEKDRARVN